jgi:hypothetical protein
MRTCMGLSFETDYFKTEKRVWDHKFRPNLPTTPWSYLKQHIVTLSLSELGTRGEGGFAFFLMKMTFFLCFCKVSEVSEYRVSDPGILKSIGVSVSNTGVEVSEDRVSDTEKSIGCQALRKSVRNSQFV